MDKTHLEHRKFTLPKGYSVKSFVLRELDGKDEMDAARWADAKTGSADNNLNAMMDENLRVAIVQVNDVPVTQPYLAMDQWSSKTRKLLVAAWAKLNSVEEEELEGFIEAAEVYQSPAAEIVPEKKAG